MKSLSVLWLLLVTGWLIVLVYTHAETWMVVVTALWSIPVSGWLVANWWQR